LHATVAHPFFAAVTLPARCGCVCAHAARCRISHAARARVAAAFPFACWTVYLASRLFIRLPCGYAMPRAAARY